MARGKPFVKSLKRLVNAGVVAKPAWMHIVEATRPPFQPVSVTRSAPIEYPEDRLRSIFLQRNHYARRIPVNIKAENASDRHIADKFVSIQLRLMEQGNLSEDEAYEAANSMLNSALRDSADFETDDLQGSLSDQNVENEAARLYLASLRDSKKDKALYQALKVRPRESQSNGA